MSRTCASSTSAPAWAIAWSSSDSPSRAEPSAARAISRMAAGATATPSSAATRSKWRISVSESMRRRSKRWQRDSTVTGSLRISVVANTNFTCSGGSSSVFSNALNALRDSMWTSSMM